MEGKELPNEDDKMNSGSNKNHEESDDFGLPDASFDSESGENKESEEAAEESSGFEYTEGSSTEDEPDEYSDTLSEEPTGTHQYSSAGQDDGDGKTPVGLIVTLGLVGVIIVGVAIYWFFFRTPKEQPAQEPVVEVVEEPPVQEPVIEEPEPVEEVMEEEPTTPAEGNFETINTKTGRYYVVLNSFFDEDMAIDYAKNMANQGVSTIILGADERTGFKRVALQEDFGGWSAAETRLNELKGMYGEEIWVLKY